MGRGVRLQAYKPRDCLGLKPIDIYYAGTALKASGRVLAGWDCFWCFLVSSLGGPGASFDLEEGADLLGPGTSAA